METNWTPWNDRLEIEGDTREEIEREEANSEAPEVPEWTEDEVCDFAARSTSPWHWERIVCQNSFKPC